MAKTTPLLEAHQRLGGRLVEFGGWRLPVQYEGILAEHRRCRSEAVVFDTSHMGQFLITGPDAPAAFAKVGTQDAEGLRVGRCRYGFLLNDDGGVIDDTILMRPAEDELLLVVNAGTAEGDLACVRDRLPAGVEAVNLIDRGWGKVDLQGPASADVLATRTDVDLSGLRYFGVARGTVCGRSVTLARTGYTGELGYEIMAAGPDLPAIWEDLLGDPRVAPAGLGARDSLRLEMCYPLYGHELSEQHNPIEAGLEFALDLDREFPGASALRRVAGAGPSRRLAALRSATRRRANPGDAILRDGVRVGEVTSGAFSPSLEVSIAMGYVEPSAAEAGAELVVRTARAELGMTVGEKPLYKEGTCRRAL